MLEDFADLGFSDEDSSPSREDRMREAFERSKLSYDNEQIFTEPGWYDPPAIPPPTKLHIRNIDYSLHNLFLQREYSKALALALSQIEVEENSFSGEGREFQLVDLAIRCALKTGNNELAGKLSDKTTKKWSSNVGLATTSVEAYLAASRPRDALSAILTVLSTRGPQIVYVSLLQRTLEALAQELKDSRALDSLLSMIRGHVHHRNSGGKEAPVTVDEGNASLWLEKCAITGGDQERLLKLLCHKSTYETEGTEERSVRTL